MNNSYPMAFLLLAISSSAMAIQEMDVTQFGLPKDANFIFCNESDCQGRTTKHLALPKPAKQQAIPVTTPQVVVAPLVLPPGEKIEPLHQSPPELSHAKVQEAPIEKPVVKAKPKKKSFKRNTKAASPECLPAGK